MNIINYLGHEIVIIKYYSNIPLSHSKHTSLTTEISTVYNELYTCNKCNFKGWNIDLNGENNPPILSCSEMIIKGIIE